MKSHTGTVYHSGGHPSMHPCSQQHHPPSIHGKPNFLLAIPSGNSQCHPQHLHWHPHRNAPPSHKPQVQRTLGQVGCLAQGIPGISKGTNMIVFIRQDNVSIDRRKDVTYGRVCINYHPKKADPNCTCLTVGGNRITYPRDWGYPHC